MPKRARLDQHNREKDIHQLKQDLGLKNIMDVPKINWDAEPRKVNAILRSIFELIELDPVTMQPMTRGDFYCNELERRWSGINRCC